MQWQLLAASNGLTKSLSVHPVAELFSAFVFSFFSIGISTHIIIIMNSIIVVTWDVNLNQTEKLLWLLTRAIKKNKLHL